MRQIKCCPNAIFRRLSLLQLLLKDVLEGDGVSSKLADAFRELVDGHGLLVEVEAEGRLVVEVLHLRDVEGGGILGIELLGDSVLGVVQVLEKVGLWKVSVCESV